MHSHDPLSNAMQQEAEKIAAITARLIAGPLTAAVRAAVSMGEMKLNVLNAASEIEELSDEQREFARKSRNAMSEEMFGMFVLREVLDFGAPTDFRKAQAKVRNMLAFTEADVERKMLPWEVDVLPAMALALNHLAEMVDRVTKEPLAESMLAMATASGQCSADDLALLQAERDKHATDNAAWYAKAQSDMDGEAVARLFRDVGLIREADDEDA